MSINVVGTALPSGLIPLSSTLGQQLLYAPDTRKNIRMVEEFKPQQNRKFCGPASLAILINAINTVYRIKMSEFKYNTPEFNELLDNLYAGKVLRFDENDIVNLKKLKEFFKSLDIENNGLTLEQLAQAATKLGFGVNRYYAESETIKTTEKLYKELASSGDKLSFKNVKDFRNFMSNYFHRPVTGLIANYKMSTLGYKGLMGHFSPLAAYNKEYDLVLVMDVWPDTQPAWVKTELLYKAMSTIDSDSGFPRGLLHIYELLF